MSCCHGCKTGKAPCAAPRTPAALLGELAPAQLERLKAHVAPLSVVYEQLGPGMIGTNQITPKMQRLVAAAVVDPRVRRACELIVQGARQGDRVQEAQALFDWQQAHLQFRRDPSEMQLLVDPLTLLTRIENTSRGANRGDSFWPVLPGGWAATNCAGHSMLMASLGHQIRLPIVWVLAGATLDTPEHIYAAMRLDGLDVNDPVADIREDLLSLDTGEPWNHVPQFGKHVEADALRVIPAFRGL